MRATNRFGILAFLALLAGCTATSQCPVPEEDARPAFVLGHGRHATLVLSNAEGNQLWRYGYGDWQYYAKARTGFWSGARALVIPSSAAFGRQAYEVESVNRNSVIRAVEVGIGEFYQFEVSGAASDALQEQLELQFAEGAEQRRHANPRYDFEFVHHPRRYWFWYNSNNQIADWLEELGCETQGWSHLSIDVAAQ